MSNTENDRAKERGRTTRWIPRDSAGRFVAGYEECPECTGTGTVKELQGIIGPQRPKEMEKPYGLCRPIETDCRRCDGRGAVYTDGCPKCGSELHNHGIMPSSCRKFGCHDCGFTELVG